MRRKVAAVFCQRRVLRFTAGLPAGYPFCRVCGVVSFVSGIRVIGLVHFLFSSADRFSNKSSITPAGVRRCAEHLNMDGDSLTAVLNLFSITPPLK